MKIQGIKKVLSSCMEGITSMRVSTLIMALATVVIAGGTIVIAVATDHMAFGTILANQATEASAEEVDEGQGIPAEIAQKSSSQKADESVVVAVQTVRATGLGAPPDAITNKTQRKILARRSAKVDAMRNLSEQLRQVTIQSRSTRDMAVMTEDEVTATVNASLRHAKVVSEKALEGELYEVVMEAPLQQ
uniref:LPP20 lipoprotein n=1 Tax=Candidatus Kentrum sp. LFY TaxID=2126342 RepID=A0A450UXU4_9GAMM|nr:MAG: LPP20 lipoprotein [Candidatus Kentron sp. LFY]VFJ97323.1 MAG: LPP20 lipoprotein [Candidatus Kentron sp. LFY]